MKKVVKNSIVALIMAMLLFTLAGCGEEKIVFKRGENDKMPMEITFKNNKAESVKMTYECDSESIANEVKPKMEKQFENAKVSVDGSKIIIEMNIKDFMKTSGTDDISEDELKKDNVIKQLKDAGYTVQK